MMKAMYLRFKKKKERKEIAEEECLKLLFNN